MPTENELKYVLRLESENEISDLSNKHYAICQAYMAFSKGISLRVRSLDDSKFIMCYKQKVKGRVIEIQKKISRRDFEDLWSVSMGKLEKIRYNLVHGSAIWEVDFFKDIDETYFALAEIEMPESQLQPDSIPDIIMSNLIYEVDRSDDRFASKRLADINYARKLYLKITKGEGHV